MKCVFISPGDIQAAERLSQEALRLNKIALGVGIALTVVYIALIVVLYTFAFGAYGGSIYYG